MSGREADDRYAPVGRRWPTSAREVVFVADVDRPAARRRTPLGPRRDRALPDAPRRSSTCSAVRTSRRSTSTRRPAWPRPSWPGCLPIALPAGRARRAGARRLVATCRTRRPRTTAPWSCCTSSGSTPGRPRPRWCATRTTPRRVAVPHGVRISGWFAVEGTIVGDGRTWDQARFNAVPLEGGVHGRRGRPGPARRQAAHREVAIADTYTMILRPTIDRLAESVAEVGGLRRR